MWKALISIICFGCISLPTNASTHLQELMKEFPYGLLTDDYGILSKLDLKINACTAIPEPFPNSRNQAYSYWQCFTVKNSKMDCERGKYDPHEEALMSMLVLSGERNGELHEFISRRPIPLGSCKLYQKDHPIKNDYVFLGKFNSNQRYFFKNYQKVTFLENIA